MSERVSPTDKIRAQIDALFTAERDLAEVLEDVARLGARLIIQAAEEAEVSEFLGRARYQRAAGADGGRPGSRNGYCPTTVKSTAGPVTIERPKLRGTTERFASRLFGAGVTKTNALESLVIAGFVHDIDGEHRNCRSRRRSLVSPIRTGIAGDPALSSNNGPPLSSFRGEARCLCTSTIESRLLWRWS